MSFHYSIIIKEKNGGLKKVRNKNGGPTWNRTRDRPVMSRWLCQLSYGPTGHIKIIYLTSENCFVKLCLLYILNKTFQFPTSGWMS
jgi:hypothetical protein